ncbi:MAG TPA: rhomboid family intramembrane serine protease [Solirubrobacteraceae bacterium]|jgi:membrane associated rhomboid family serine protease|nr:rhomboid family intramembrane serine protease [Solirubrobacteraceae bacterium]
MSTAVSDQSARPPRPVKYRSQREGITLLASMVALMWIVEIINTIDSNRLDSDGIWARSVSHLWGIVTAPFLHASFQHLFWNTLPLVFLGVIIALHGARRLALVTAIVILLGGLGTWLIAPAHSITVGASGLVFGYATYLLVRGFFDRSALEVLVGIVVGVVWGGALIGSLVPQGHVSWQGHLAGGIAGVIAAYGLRKPRAKPAAAAPAPAQ